ncbi:MAG TPA: PAS domain-containing protein [Longimicrobium sp.]|jgi:PAS domain S-box-containing protein
MPSPEARHRDHEARYGAAREGVCVLAPDWRFRYVNASLLEILHLLGKREGVSSLWDALPGWRGTPEAESLERAMEDRAAVCFRVAGARGAGRTWEVEAEPLPSGDLRVHVRHATPRATPAPETAATREARLASMVAHLPVAVALLDAETLEVREANAACHTLLTAPWRAPGSLAGHTPAEIVPGWAGSEAEQRVKRVVETGEPWEVAELRVPPTGPRPVWLRLNVRMVDVPDGRRHLLVVAVEVTNPVRARRAAEAERRALFDILDTLPVGVVVAWAPEGRIAYVNPAGASLGGRTSEELGDDDAGSYLAHWPLRTPAGEPFDPEDIPLVRALRGEATPEVEMVIPLPDGKERTVLGIGVPLRDAAGEVDRAMVAFYDITERLRLERALIERQVEAEAAAADAALRAEESRALREIGRLLVSELDPARVLDLATRSAMELLGSRGAYVNAARGDGRARVGPALGIMAQVNGAVFPLAGSSLEIVQREGRTLVYNSPGEIPGGTGTLATFHRLGVRNVILAPMRAFGESFGVLGVVDRAEPFTPEDVRVLEALADSAAMAMHNARLLAGERRRADESRALLAAAEALSSTLDPAEVTARIVGIAEELTGAAGAGLTLVTGKAQDRVRTAVATGPLVPIQGLEGVLAGSLTEQVLRGGAPLILDTGDPDAPAPLRNLSQLGVGVLAAAPLRVGDEGLGVIAVVNPPGAPAFTGEHLRLLSLLANHAAIAVRNARLYEAAQEASHAKSNFLATMSHELRTPLNALEGYASLMADEIYGAVNQRQAHALSRMRASQRHLLGLIEQVLDVARLEAGAKRPEPEEVNLVSLAGSVVDALCGAAERKHLTLQIESEATPRIRTDLGMVRQILTNMVGNALKFTEHGGVVVRVRPHDGGVAVEVEDTGPGIAAEHVERVWEPFYQVEPTMTRREGGTGLGLPLAREYARILGGDLTVRSAPGTGSTFTLTLPHHLPPDP